MRIERVIAVFTVMRARFFKKENVLVVNQRESQKIRILIQSGIAKFASVL
jgi:hypothetical protein